MGNKPISHQFIEDFTSSKQQTYRSLRISHRTILVSLVKKTSFAVFHESGPLASIDSIVTEKGVYLPWRVIPQFLVFSVCSGSWKPLRSPLEWILGSHHIIRESCSPFRTEQGGRPPFSQQKGDSLAVLLWRGKFRGFVSSTIYYRTELETTHGPASNPVKVWIKVLFGSISSRIDR